MVILFQIFAILINAFYFIKTLKNLHYNLKIIYVILLLFQVIFVLPIIIEWFFGVQDYSSKSLRFEMALNDSTTSVIYSLFVIIISSAFYFYGKKNKNNNPLLNDFHNIIKKIRIDKAILPFIFFMMFIPLFLAFFSPSPEKYFTEYAYFQRFSIYASRYELWYHRNVMKIGGYLALLSVVIYRLLSRNHCLNTILIIIAAIIAGILDGKRTLFAFILFAIIAVDILKTPKGKFPIIKMTITSLFILTFFIWYAFIIDKHPVGVDSIDNLRLYFFRDVDVKFSIYALLNPDKFRMLEYWGQSYLFNLFQFVPREIWMNKPYPYDTYLTAVALGYSPGTIISWNYQTSLFGEAISNLGWLGIPFSIFMIIKFISISERTRNPLIIALALFIVMFSFMNHFGSFSFYFIIWVILMIKTKIKVT